MKARSTPWLSRRGAGWRAAKGVHPWYANTSCLSDHFDIPVGTERIRFVKGKTLESLHLQWSNPNQSYFVTQHRQLQRDAVVVMTVPFDEWFGPRDGWVWVELG